MDRYPPRVTIRYCPGCGWEFIPEPIAPRDPPGYTLLGGSSYEGDFFDDIGFMLAEGYRTTARKLGHRGRWVLQLIVLTGLLYAVFSALGM